MRLVPIRPAGVRLTAGSNLKAKGMHMVPTIAQVVSGDEGGWGPMWDTGWDWDGWMRPSIDAAIDSGATLVRISGPGTAALSPTTTGLRRAHVDRMHQWLDYTQEAGLLVYWQPPVHAVDATLLERVRIAVEQARIVRDYPNVVAYEIWGEIDNAYSMGDPVFSTDLGHVVVYAALVREQIREFSRLPLTVSFSASHWPPDPDDPLLVALAPYIDVWDFHPYQTTAGTPRPQACDYDALRASVRRKPYIIGECGTPTATNWGNWPYDPETQLGHTLDIGRTVQEDPDCLGAVFFPVADTGTDAMGMYPTLGDPARTLFSEAFATWPAVG